ncbi:hypothetical protein V8C86DRAFT_316498 [Haematococcus lacustris]
MTQFLIIKARQWWRWLCQYPHSCLLKCRGSHPVQAHRGVPGPMLASLARPKTLEPAAALPALAPSASLVHRNHLEGWSPTKLASLSFFLQSQPPSQPAPALVAPSTISSASTATATVGAGGEVVQAQGSALEAHRPYLGLKYLLHQGPSGASVPRSWRDQQAARLAPFMPAQQQGAGGPGQGLRGGRPAVAGRYTPYTLGKGLGRAGADRSSNGPSAAQTPSALRPATPSYDPAATQPAWQAAATATPTVSATSALGRQLQPTAQRSLLGAGLAGSRSVAGTPLGKATPSAALLSPLQQQQQQQGGGRGLVVQALQFASTPGGGVSRAGTPLATPRLGQGPVGTSGWEGLGGAVGAPGQGLGLKRGRDSPGTSSAATPLMASGIKNLTEYKRQRQRYTQQPGSLALAAGGAATPGAARRPLLALGAALGGRVGGSRQGLGGGEAGSGGATPVAGEVADRALATPLDLQGGGLQAGVQAEHGITETARRIMAALDNMAKVNDNAGHTPFPGSRQAAAAPPAAAPPAAQAQSLGRPGATPFQRSSSGQAPPLDQATPQHTPQAVRPRTFAFTPPTADATPGTPSVVFGTSTTTTTTTIAAGSTPYPLSRSSSGGQGTPSPLPVLGTQTQTFAFLAQPATSPNTKSSTRSTKSVRFAVPEDEEGEGEEQQQQQQQQALRPSAPSAISTPALAAALPPTHTTQPATLRTSAPAAAATAAATAAAPAPATAAVTAAAAAGSNAHTVPSSAPAQGVSRADGAAATAAAATTAAAAAVTRQSSSITTHASYSGDHGFTD